MLLEGKKLLVTGVLMDSSIAFHVAKLAQEQGAEVVLTSFGRTMKITPAIARRLPETPPVVELDVTSDDDLAALADRVREHVRAPRRRRALDRLRPSRVRFNFMEAGWDDVSTAVQVSAYSLASLAKAAAAADVRGRQRRRAHLRRAVRLAGLRLDGRGEGRVRVDQPLPRPRPRGRRGSAATSSRPGRSAPPPRSRSPGFERFEEEWGEPGPAGLGRQRRRARRPGLRRAAVRLVPAPRPARSCTSTVASTRWASSLQSATRLHG